MTLKRFARAVFRRLLHKVPRRLRTRGIAARVRVDQLSPGERERLRENLRRLVHPKTA